MPLNIPFEQKTARRHNWRVVWIIIFCIISLLLALFVQQILEARDLTSQLKPESTQFTIHLELSPKIRRILDEKTGHISIIDGAPWTLHDALSWANQEFSLHVSNRGIVAVSIDQELPEDVKGMLTTLNLFPLTDANGNTRGISLIPAEKALNPKTSIQPLLLNPRSNGIVILNETNEKLSLNITKKRFTIMGIGLQNKMIPLDFPENTQVIAQIHLNNSQSIQNIGLDYINFENDLIPNSGSLYLTIALDDQTPIYSLLFEGSGAQLDDLARLGNEIISRKTLSTAAWTIDKETTVTEIVSLPDNIQSNISTDQGITTLSFSNEAGDYVRIIKSEETVVITNRQYSLNLIETKASSLCANTQQFMKPNELLALRNDNSIIRSVKPISAIKEIAFKKKKTIFCWE
ncbi:MAG: hypothetical protein ABH826_00720 [Patescibacteria group bacterium]|nr:hypothetical protein [Patescibacteria group bacterium]